MIDNILCKLYSEKYGGFWVLSSRQDSFTRIIGMKSVTFSLYYRPFEVPTATEFMTITIEGPATVSFESLEETGYYELFKSFINGSEQISDSFNSRDSKPVN